MNHWIAERKKFRSRKLCADPDKCPACIDFWKQFALLINLGCCVTYWQMNLDWGRKHKDLVKRLTAQRKGKL